MAIPLVIHHKDLPLYKDAIYVGRPSKFGNPYVIGKDGTRSQVIQKFRTYLFADRVLLEEVKTQLKGKVLVCWCKPKACHGDVLLEVANQKPSLFNKIQNGIQPPNQD